MERLKRLKLYREKKLMLTRKCTMEEMLKKPLPKKHLLKKHQLSLRPLHLPQRMPDMS